MSGHSKWSSIKHKKGAADARRGKLFTKLARAITVAARDGGGDPEGNATLATAIQKARDNSMPKDNIQRAIDRGTGEGSDGTILEHIVYEGYGPGGTALMVDATSDNRNRTGSELRHAFDRNGGSLGEPNSVAWQFEKRGVILLDGERYDEDDLLVAIEAGAEDVDSDGDVIRVLTAPSDLTSVRSALEAEGMDVESADVVMDPKNTVEVDEGDAKQLLRLIETLEDHDDVDAVHANFDMSDEVMESALA